MSSERTTVVPMKTVGKVGKFALPQCLIPWVRVVAWGMLMIATGVLMRAEAVVADLPDDVKFTSDLTYREVDGLALKLDVYEPDVRDSSVRAPLRPAILALHGGGWRGGSKSDYGRSLIPLVKAGFVVVAVDYRLSRPGKASWPHNLEDVQAALAWLQSRSLDYGVDPTRIAVMGASAGGHLALLLGENPTPLGNPKPVRAVIDFYGPTDLDGLRRARPGTSVSTDLMIGGDPELFPDQYTTASPIHGVRDSHPATLIVHGTDDLVVPVAQSQNYAERLNESGVRNRLIVLDNARHGFGLQVGDRNLVPDILEFLKLTWD